MNTFIKTSMVLLSISTLSLTACIQKTPDTQASSAPATHDMQQMNGMTHMQVTTDEAFIKGMIPHHQEAVDTSMLIAKNTQNPELKKFAQAVVNGQSAEIEQMKKWHQTWFKKPYVADTTYMPMMGDVNQYATGNQTADTQYIKNMIVHHEGAVQMAQQALGFTQRAEIKEMANAIVKTQTTEIVLLKSWLK